MFDYIMFDGVDVDYLIYEFIDCGVINVVFFRWGIWVFLLIVPLPVDEVPTYFTEVKFLILNHESVFIMD